MCSTAGGPYGQRDGANLDEGVRKAGEDVDVRQQDVERDGVAGEAPEVGGEEVEDGGHHLAQHVHVEADARKPADDHHEGVAERKTGH